MADTTSYLDQVTANYKCGDFNVGLKSSNAEQEALTNYVMLKLQNADQVVGNLDSESSPTLQQYFDKLACGGQDNQLSNAEAWYILGQIELFLFANAS